MKPKLRHKLAAFLMCGVILSLHVPAAHAIYTCQLTGKQLSYCCCKAEQAAEPASQAKPIKSCCKKAEKQVQLRDCGCCKVSLTTSASAEIGALSPDSMGGGRELPGPISSHCAAVSLPTPAWANISGSPPTLERFSTFPPVFLLNRVIRR
ncbi:hypothetical protein HYR69_01415 [Candidatus Sumerlaeota bacterium]|nr:hypothetical protein [Candidatus Sumerlaeota bacterium]